MLDDFFTRAVLGGIGIAIVAGPIGCFIIWRRLAYFGDTLSHSALLGVALALLLQLNITLTVFMISFGVALMLLILRRGATLSSDALLGLLAHSTLAIGLVMLAFMSWVRVDLMGFLFGDILAVTRFDLALIWIGGAVILGLLAYIWRPLFAATVNVDLATAEGARPELFNLVFMLIISAVIAVSMKLVGVLLITALLIIPAASARRLVTSPEQMAVGASVVGVVAVLVGLNGSLRFDTPAGPSIVVAAMICFILLVLPIPRIFAKVKQGHESYICFANKKVNVMNKHAKDTSKLTKNQSLVLEALSGARQPLGAYALLDRLRNEGFKAPLQVYRPLDQLAAIGLVHRLESLNAWTVCCAESHQGTPIFAICNDCGMVTEHLDEQLSSTIEALPEMSGFVPDRSIVEIYGQCGECSDQ